jgi:hypothetical protein
MKPEGFKVWQQVPLKGGDIYDLHTVILRLVYELYIYKQQIMQPEVRLLTF